MATVVQSPIRKQLLEAFAEANGEFLSGQTLAKILGCSRTAVWKHIEELRKEGYQLEAVRKKGYRIVQAPDKVTENEIQFGLQTKRLGQTIYYEESVESTQQIAHRLSYEGYPEGTLVISEEQVAGRGRMTRSWYSPKYTGIWMSLILRPNLPPQKAPQFTLIAAVAISQAIEEISGIEAEIKWPNDILIRGKKVTGILTELQADADKIHSIIIGMGVNVNQSSTDFAADIKPIATSIAIEAKKKIPRAQLVRRILEKLEIYYDLYMEEGFRPIKLMWESRAVSIGKNIIARTINGTIEGKALGITDEGILQLEDAQGIIHHIYSADIEIKS
ncbi:biotin--[acetyl-CoA-carboxylase] ligase [Aeribacillus pallidus]|uniref:biotin--[acetyl-CoA-carboxylase] ligase n=1 Tax=Aeribacillus pallidus TaxID=33936 RepID=UPI003D21CEAE